MSTKGTLTWVGESPFSGQLTKRTKKIMWMDGYDAWLCIFRGIGETAGWGHREFKPTSYGFTYVQPQKLLKLSPKYDDEFAREYVRERTLDLHKYNAGQLINDGFILAWLTPEEHKELRKYYLEKEEEYGKERGN